MKLLLDHDVYAATWRFLVGLGHDAIRVGDIGMWRAADEELLRVAAQQDRVFVTRDRDYGALVFVRSLGAGVLYLRMLPSTQNAVHDELHRVLKLHSQSELQNAFVVIEPGGHRSGGGNHLFNACPQPAAGASNVLLFLSPFHAPFGIHVPLPGHAPMGANDRRMPPTHQFLKNRPRHSAKGQRPPRNCPRTLANRPLRGCRDHHRRETLPADA
jgi:predicted nuclease of predicted toxin-antitoxin system